MNKGRKSSGGKYKRPNQARLHSRVGKVRVVKIGKRKTKVLRGRGSIKKTVSLMAKEVNLIVNGKAKKSEIKNVLETPSNRFLARQNILLKGSLIETTDGKARITNRPSQEGMVQAVLVKA